jgi:cytochrome c
MERNMFDTMTVTKVGASLCGMLLVLLLGAWAAESLYHVGGHYGEQAYVIETGERWRWRPNPSRRSPSRRSSQPQTQASGEGLWRQCQACHQLNGTDGVGPHLNGVVGREKAVGRGLFDYSDGALAQAGDVWSPENLAGFLESPRDYMPGTKMSYSGMRDIEDRANLIAYLAQTEG